MAIRAAQAASSASFVDAGARAAAAHGALPPGSLIGIVAPAGPTSAERLAFVPALFEAAGYRVRLYPGCAARHGALPYLAGSDGQRLADLHAALVDAEVAAIHALRGGYGCMRLLPAIDRALVRRQRKLLVGYSDLTALLALWAAEGAPALHAPMVSSDIVLPERAADRVALFARLQQGLRAGEVLSAGDLDGHVDAHVDAKAAAPGLARPGVAEGRLVGGNLSLVAALQGTPFAWPTQGTVLFLEDVNEEPYRIDRLLTQLQLAGVLEGAAGFVLGSFTHESDPTAALLDRLGALGKPVLAGWPAGHGAVNRPLPLGLRVRLDAAARTITLLEDWGASA